MLYLLMRQLPNHITDANNYQKQSAKQQKHPKIELNRTRSDVKRCECIHPKENESYSYPYQAKECYQLD